MATEFVGARSPPRGSGRAGAGLIGFYGFCAAHLAGESLSGSALRALAVGLIGAFLIALKALLH